MYEEVPFGRAPALEAEWEDEFEDEFELEGEDELFLGRLGTWASQAGKRIQNWSRRPAARKLFRGLRKAGLAGARSLSTSLLGSWSPTTPAGRMAASMLRPGIAGGLDYLDHTYGQEAEFELEDLSRPEVEALMEYYGAAAAEAESEEEAEAYAQALMPLAERLTSRRTRRVLKKKTPRLMGAVKGVSRKLSGSTRRPKPAGLRRKRLPSRFKPRPLRGPTHGRRRRICLHGRCRRPRYLTRFVTINSSDTDWSTRRRRLLRVLPAAVRATVRRVDRKVARGEVVSTSQIVSWLARYATRALTDRAYRVRLLARHRRLAARGEFLLEQHVGKPCKCRH